MSWTADRFRRKGRPPHLEEIGPPQLDAPTLDAATFVAYKNPAPPQNGPAIRYKFRPDGRLLFASCG